MLDFALFVSYHGKSNQYSIMEIIMPTGKTRKVTSESQELGSLPRGITKPSSKK